MATSSSTMNFNFCILRRLQKTILRHLLLCKNMRKPRIWIWKPFLSTCCLGARWGDFHFLQFDERTRRFKLQSIEVSYCDWGAANVWCHAHSLHFSNARFWRTNKAAHWSTRSLRRALAASVPRLGPQRFRNSFCFQVGVFFCQNSSTKKQLLYSLIHIWSIVWKADLY